MTTRTPSRSAFSKSRMTRSASARLFTGGPTRQSATPASWSAISWAYPAWRSVMPGIMWSYNACMMPRMPILGRPAPGCCSVTAEPPSSLPVGGLVTLVQCVNLCLVERNRLTAGTGEVHRPRHVLTHHRGLHRRLGGGADGEHAMTAHEHRGRPMPGQGRHDALADVVVADQREWTDG